MCQHCARLAWFFFVFRLGRINLDSDFWLKSLSLPLCDKKCNFFTFLQHNENARKMLWGASSGTWSSSRWSRKRLQLSLDSKLELLQTPLAEKQHNFILNLAAASFLSLYRVQCLTVAKFAFTGFQGGFKVDGIWMWTRLISRYSYCLSSRLSLNLHGLGLLHHTQNQTGTGGWELMQRQDWENKSFIFFQFSMFLPC